MQTEFITQKLEETKKLGKILAGELRGGEVICLSGELGAGKTTFTQGLLSGLGAQRPYTSPTFVVMKEYQTGSSEQETMNLPVPRLRQVSSKKKAKEIKTIYHFDAYRVSVEDILSLGWEEIISNPSNICIIEWADKVEKIIPARAVWIAFEWISEKQRKLTIRNTKDQKLAKIPKAC